MEEPSTRLKVPGSAVSKPQLLEKHQGEKTNQFGLQSNYPEDRQVL
jgi:hypothetical protein